MSQIQRNVLPSPPKKTQGGVALAISLILLVVLTLLGLSTVKTVSTQEKMVSQSYDRSLAYQYVEAALREGEAQARIQSLNANAAFPLNQHLQNNVCTGVNDCANGLCSAPDPDCQPRWENPAFTQNNWTTYTGVAAIVSQSGNTLIGAAGASAPQYFVEIIRPVSAAPCTPLVLSFDQTCNQLYPDPDSIKPCDPNKQNTATTQACIYYRYRITAKVEIPGRATVMLQSIYSVQPN